MGVVWRAPLFGWRTALLEDVAASTVQLQSIRTKCSASLAFFSFTTWVVGGCAA